jgi:hypothetical protein
MKKMPSGVFFMGIFSGKAYFSWYGLYFSRYGAYLASNGAYFNFNGAYSACRKKMP